LFLLVDEYGNKVENGKKGMLLHNGGTVCADEGFDQVAASAICKAMGHRGAVRWSTGSYDKQHGFGVAMGGVKCRKDIWTFCYSWRPSYCSDDGDVFLECTEGKHCLSIIFDS
jgi:hypothetical protein